MALTISLRPNIENIVITIPSGERLVITPDTILYHGQQKHRLLLSGPRTFSVSREPITPPRPSPTPLPPTPDSP